MSDDERKNAVCLAYVKAADLLATLHRGKASAEEIAAAKARENNAWDEVKKLMPEALCR